MEFPGTHPASRGPVASRDRRRRFRHSVQAVTYVRVGGIPGGAGPELKLVDISEDGLCLQGQLSAETGRVLDLSLHLTEGRLPMHTKGEVAWRNSLGHTGIRFLQMREGTLRRLKEWIFLNLLGSAEGTSSGSTDALIAVDHSHVKASKADLVAHEEAFSFPPDHTSLLAALSAVKRELQMIGADWDTALPLVARRAMTFTGASGAAIALSDGRQMVCHATAGPDAPGVGARIRSDYGFSGECLRSREPICCDDAERDPRVDPEVCRVLGIRSIAGTAIVMDGAILGLIEVLSPKSYAFGPEACLVLKHLSEAIPIAIKRSGRSIQSLPHPAPAAPKKLVAPPRKRSVLPPRQIVSAPQPFVAAPQQYPAAAQTFTPPSQQYAPPSQQFVPPPQQQFARPAEQFVSAPRRFTPPPQRPAPPPASYATSPAEYEGPQQYAAPRQRFEPLPPLQYDPPPIETSNETWPAEAPNFEAPHFMTETDSPGFGRVVRVSTVGVLLCVVAWGVVPWKRIMRAARGQSTSGSTSVQVPITQPAVSSGLSVDTLRKLAEKGNADAQFALGRHYATGDQVMQDYALAARWFTSAADQGNAVAQEVLGSYYYHGRGVQVDYVQSYVWLSLARAGGRKSSELLLPMLVSRMNRDQIFRAQQQADRWLRTHGISSNPAGLALTAQKR